MSQRSDIHSDRLLYPPTPDDENPQEASVVSVIDETTPTGEEKTFIQKYLGRIITAILALALIGVVCVLLPYNAVHAAKNERWNETLYWTAGAFVLIAVPVSVYGIIQHLVNYYMPQVQKYVIRILFMVPIFSIQAWFSLFFHR